MLEITSEKSCFIDFPMWNFVSTDHVAGKDQNAQDVVIFECGSPQDALRLGALDGALGLKMTHFFQKKPTGNHVCTKHFPF